jgi:phosphoribosylaminoimidazolecarboxamide formyltransferase/IMP cyclohydrolase
MKKYALISVSDKSGIEKLGKALSQAGFEILATGNTAKKLTENGVAVTEVGDFTSFPEIFDGRVKTLNPKIFGGILMRRNNETDTSEANKNGIAPIDVVCVNLYPFAKTLADKNSTLQDKIENIDIGGPSLIRAAAKNFEHVAVLTNPQQYDDFIAELNQGEISLETRKRLAAEAFAHTANYDRIIADYFEKEFLGVEKHLRINAPLNRTLRYGENPHQSAAFYGDFETYFETLHGKELSYNNIVDLFAAVELATELGNNAVAIIKHTNPAGAAVRDDVFTAYTEALSGDPVSAFGGIVAVNGSVDEQTATKMNEIFLEVIAARNFTEAALSVLKKKKQRRIVWIKNAPHQNKVIKSVPGGFLVQDADNSRADKIEFKLVSQGEERHSADELKFAWVVAKHVKSNAIAITRRRKIIGVGAGQMSRVDAAKIAITKANEFGHELNGAIAASDAFFPFADGLEILAEAGVTSVVEPGGSKRDEEVIEAANEKNVALYFTGIRNFRH